jgi:pyruvate carboxylase
MAYELKVDGMAEISELLSKLEEAAPAIAAEALYEGAGTMSAAINSAAESIKTGPGSTREEARYATPEEKAAVLVAGAGIAKFDKTGTEVNTSVGYKSAGYAVIKGKTKPVPLIVNAINSGTSFMHKQPFVRQAARSGGAKAMSVMTAFIEDAFGKITK